MGQGVHDRVFGAPPQECILDVKTNGRVQIVVIERKPIRVPEDLVADGSWSVAYKRSVSPDTYTRTGKSYRLWHWTPPVGCRRRLDWTEAQCSPQAASANTLTG